MKKSKQNGAKVLNLHPDKNETPLYLMCCLSLVGLAIHQYKEFTNTISKTPDGKKYNQTFKLGSTVLHLNNADNVILIEHTSASAIIDTHDQFIEFCKTYIK